MGRSSKFCFLAIEVRLKIEIRRVIHKHLPNKNSNVIHYCNDVSFIRSMHITLSMLASSASDNSDTQKQLLQVLGRTNNLQNLEKYYDTTLTDYEVRKMTQIMSLESYLDLSVMIITKKPKYD